MADEKPPEASKVVSIVRELRNEQLEREAIEAEGNDRTPPANGKAKAKPREFPRGVWLGTMRELGGLNLPDPVSIGQLGAIPLGAGERTLIHGAPSTCKTLLAYHGALGHAIAGGRTLLVQGEGRKRATLDRLRRLGRGLMLGGITDDIEDRIHILHGAFDLEQELKTFDEHVDRLKPSLVIVDPLVSFSRAKENDAAEVSAFLRCFDVAHETGASVIVLHHATKPDQYGRTRERGSGAIRAWADSSIGLSATDVAGEIKCDHDKCRDDVKQPKRLLKWRFSEEEIVLTTEELDAPAPPKREEPKRKEPASVLQGKRTQQLVELLAKKGGLTREEIKERTGWGGAQLGAVLEALFRDAKVHGTKELRQNARKQSRPTEVIRLGPAPDPVLTRDPEPGSSVGIDPDSDADPDSSRLRPKEGSSDRE